MISKRTRYVYTLVLCLEKETQAKNIDRIANPVKFNTLYIPFSRIEQVISANNALLELIQSQK